MELDQHRGGSGEPLVLLHGIGHTWRGWKPMLPLLEQRFDVLALDLPGFGRSPTLPAGVEPTPEALADAVEATMDQAGFDHAHLAGNSLGGWIALELARRGRALTVVALSPAGLQHKRERGWGRNVLRGMRWLAQNVPAQEAILRNGLGRTLFAGLTIARPWRVDPNDMIEQTELFGQARGFLPTLPHTFAGQVRGLDSISCPVLILWGTRDLLLLPRQARRFERLIPGCEVRYLKGLGHTPMSDDPELLAELVVQRALAARPRRVPRAAAPA
ncbi:MAG: alpha/beta fold hydrolase [Thermoleophilaceae bacterium]